jgi:iron-sulfur cluster assembly protein
MSTKRKMQTSTYQAYTLDNAPPPPRNAGAPPSSINAGIPQVNETRPPQFTEHQLPRRQEQVSEGEAQKSKPLSAASPAAQAAPSTQAAKPKPKSRLRARKAAIKLTPSAVDQLRALLDNPEPKLIKVGVRNRGCSGLAYDLSYVDKPGPFDEMVEQDGVQVLIDSKALFSIIGSEMDWAEDKLSQRFVFHNPNISESSVVRRAGKYMLTNSSEEQCGCGESFMV